MKSESKSENPTSENKTETEKSVASAKKDGENQPAKAPVSLLFSNR